MQSPLRSSPLSSALTSRLLSLTIGTLLLALVVALAGCDTRKDSGADPSARVRLDTSNGSAAFGDYVIRVSAQLTSDLSPEVAQTYGITRSENQGYVNLVLLRKDPATGMEMPTKARVTMSAANLTGQLKDTELQEIEVAESIYYIAVVDVIDREVINFDFDVRPVDSNRLLQVRFSYEFYAR